MKTKLAVTHVMVLALLPVSVDRVATSAFADPPKPAAEQKEQRPFISITESHEERISALQSERRKLKTGKSTLIVVHQCAKDVRDVELQMSSTPTQRVAALARYGALVRELEDEVSTTLGHVINLSSIGGFQVWPTCAVYSGTKFAVRAISEGLRLETKEIRVTIISPGVVESELASTITDPATQAAIADYRKVALTSDAIARAMAYAIEQPADVDVNEIIVRPTAGAQ